MTDIFLSYSSMDLSRVRPIRDGLAEHGFDVFWDQKLPTGKDWDAWIRQHLTAAKCALVVWSKNSVTSRNVRHEATIADGQGKLLAVLIDDLRPEEFPMGLYVSQCAKLDRWSGDTNDDAWRNFRDEVEAKLTPRWVKESIDRIEVRLVAEQARREAAEKRNKTFRDQIEKEAHTQAELKHELEEALQEVAALKEKIPHAAHGGDRVLKEVAQEIAALKKELASAAHGRDRAREEIKGLKEEFVKAARERDQALGEIAVLRARLEKIVHERIVALLRRPRASKIPLPKSYTVSDAKAALRRLAAQSQTCTRVRTQR